MLQLEKPWNGIATDVTFGGGGGVDVLHLKVSRDCTFVRTRTKGSKGRGYMEKGRKM